MPSFTTRRNVPFTATEMFDLVADVERYPEFLPLCKSLTVRTRTALQEGEELVATMGVGYKALSEAFTTRVLLKPAQSLILVEYLDGPFSHLENRWRFADKTAGSEVDFFINYEFRSPALALVMGALFDKAFRRFAEAFEARARLVYGDPSAIHRMPVAASPKEC